MKSSKIPSVRKGVLPPPSNLTYNVCKSIGVSSNNNHPSSKTTPIANVSTTANSFCSNNIVNDNYPTVFLDRQISSPKGKTIATNLLRAPEILNKNFPKQINNSFKALQLAKSTHIPKTLQSKSTNISKSATSSNSSLNFNSRSSKINNQEKINRKSLQLEGIHKNEKISESKSAKFGNNNIGIFNKSCTTPNKGFSKPGNLVVRSKQQLNTKNRSFIKSIDINNKGINYIKSINNDIIVNKGDNKIKYTSPHFHMIKNYNEEYTNNEAVINMIKNDIVMDDFENLNIEKDIQEVKELIRKISDSKFEDNSISNIVDIQCNGAPTPKWTEKVDISIRNDQTSSDKNSDSLIRGNTRNNYETFNEKDDKVCDFVVLKLSDYLDTLTELNEIRTMLALLKTALDDSNNSDLNGSLRLCPLNPEPSRSLSTESLLSNLAETTNLSLFDSGLEGENLNSNHIETNNTTDVDNDNNVSTPLSHDHDCSFDACTQTDSPPSSFDPTQKEIHNYDSSTYEIKKGTTRPHTSINDIFPEPT